MGSAKAVFPMREEQFASVTHHPSDDLGVRLEHLIEGLLLALVAFVPWPFGSVDAWPQEVIICAAAVLLLLFIAKLLLVRHARVTWNWTYLPIGLFLLLAGFQLIPLPHRLLSLISPNTLRVKSHLLPDLPDAAKGPMTLTFDGNATRHDLRLVLACAVIFFVALNVLRTRGRIKRVLIAISAVGGMAILLALAQDMTNAGKIYWAFQTRYRTAISGPFAGHNDFPLFANMSIGAAVALLAYLNFDWMRPRLHRSHGELSKLGSGWRIAINVVLVAVIMLGAGAVFLTLSRSGLFAMAAAAVCMMIIAGVRWHLNIEGWLIGACLMLCFAASAYFASYSVIHRLATLQHPLEEYGSRWQMVKDILAAWPKFPLLGTGLGTHEAVYPMFEHLLYTPNFDHAENEYVQMLEETGILGLGIVLWFIGLIVAAFARASKQSTNSAISSASFGLGLGLLAIAFQSGFGFGAHKPANAVLIAVECALLVNIARISDGGNEHSNGKVRREAHSRGSSRVFTSLMWAVMVGACVCLVPAILSADRARRGEAEWEPAHRLLEDLHVSLGTRTPEMEQEISLAAQMAHHAEPDRVKYFYWEAAYQLNQIESRHDPNADEDVRTAAEKLALRKVLEQFNAIRELSPAYGMAIYRAGEIRYLIFDEPGGLDLIRLAASVAPTSPDIFATLASIEGDRGDFAGAIETYQHYLSLEGEIHGSFQVVVDSLVTDKKRPDLAIKLAGDDPERQLAIVSALRAFANRPDFQSMATSLEKKASSAQREQLAKRCANPDADPSDLAKLAGLYRDEHDLNAAIACYQRALAKDYGNVQWHLALAQTLLANGQKQNAIDEAAICLHLQPQMPEAEQLISDASSQKAAPEKP